MRPLLLLAGLVLGVSGLTAAAPEEPDAILLLAADLHSAYDRSAQFLARVDRIRAENPGKPLAILIDGDVFEGGNGVARRSGGAVDFALLRGLAERAPTILNLGNHEPEFFDLEETISRVRACGVQVVGGNLRNRGKGQAFAPASARIALGGREAIVVGVTTDRLETFRAAVRPTLEIEDPIAWARRNLPALLDAASIPIVLSHAGLTVDRALFSAVPDGTLLVGAHDHLRLVFATGRTVYVHSGSWTEFLSVANHYAGPGKGRWVVEQVQLGPDDPRDPVLARLIEETMARYLTPSDREIIGRTPQPLGPEAAARFAVGAARQAAAADVAVIGATTFGAGLPGGDVTRYALDACVRFDGSLFIGEIDGRRLKELIAGANQGAGTPFDQRKGENLVAVGPAEIVETQRYRLVTSDWIAHNPSAYLGSAPPALSERPDLRLKAAVVAALGTR